MGVLAAALVVPVAGVTATAALGHAYEDKVVLDRGHADVFDVQQTGSGLRLFVHDGTQGAAVDRAPGDVVLHVTDASKRTVSATVADALPGFAQAGTEAWVLPQSSTGDQLYAGWATERLPAGSLAEGTRVTFTVTGVQGPGEFALWQSDLDGPAVKVNSADGLPDAFQPAAAYSHDHGNWAFTAEGEYLVTVKASATLADGSNVSTPDTTYRFYVGAELPPAAEQPEPSVTIGNWKEFYTTNEVYTITAVHPELSEVTGYKWWQYLRATMGDGTRWEGWIVLGSDKDFEVCTGVDCDGGRVKVELLGADGAVIATSEEREVRLVPEEDWTDGLNVTGLRNHYHSTETVNLEAKVYPEPSALTDFEWLTLAPGATEWVPVGEARTSRYAFPVGPRDNGLQVRARLYDTDGTVAFESPPVTIVVDDHGDEPPADQTLTTTLHADQGALMISVDPEDRDVVLTDLALNPAADRYTATGELGTVNVIDTRIASTGWNVMGRSYEFISVDGDTIDGVNLGWQPAVLSTTDGLTVTPGPVVPTALDGGRYGLQANSVLGSSEAGGAGRAELGGSLTLDAPLSTKPGTYTALLVFTVI